MVARVLHAPRPPSADLTLIFSHYTNQAGPLFSPLQFKVLVAIENLPAHAWSLVLIFDVAPVSATSFDLSQFLVTAWARHPDLTPNEVGGIILEPVEPFIEHAPPLFLSSSELVHSKCDTLQFRIFIRVLEVHDYSIPEDSDDDPSESSDDSGGDGIPGPQPSLGSSLFPWWRIF
jgi:hypothetical protein